jgi:hypothetical protein
MRQEHKAGEIINQYSKLKITTYGYDDESGEPCLVHNKPKGHSPFELAKMQVEAVSNMIQEMKAKYFLGFRYPNEVNREMNYWIDVRSEILKLEKEAFKTIKK